MLRSYIELEEFLAGPEHRPASALRMYARDSPASQKVVTTPAVAAPSRKPGSHLKGGSSPKRSKSASSSVENEHRNVSPFDASASWGSVPGLAEYAADEVATATFLSKSDKLVRMYYLNWCHAAIRRSSWYVVLVSMFRFVSEYARRLQPRKQRL